MGNDYNISTNGITREQFLSSLANKDETYKEQAIKIFDLYSKKNIDDNILDETEQEMAQNAFSELGLDLTNKQKYKAEDITSGFFQYVTQDKNFTGKLINNQTMNIPADCTQKDNGIEYNGKLYIMRGSTEDSSNPLRFECDETKTTLRQALSQTKSNDKVHKYHNHGDTVNNASTYNKETGIISHGQDETAVTQTQTFASMVMNSAEESTLKLDEQKNNKGKTTTTGETILDTINTDNDDGISMQELISYLNAVQQESATVKKKAGARKFAGGVDLDIKDLSNIGKVFKKYAGEDNKLQKEELQNLLNDLKENSISKLATGDDDKYIGEKPTHKKPNDNSKTTQKNDNIKPLEGNRKRKVKPDTKTKGYGEKQEYYYHDGVRTSLKEIKKDDKTITIEDNNGNIAQVGHSSLFKKRFEYIEGLPKEVRAKVIEGKIDNNDEPQEIVKMKDKNGIESYYTITTQDKKYKLGEELTKKEDKFLTKNQVKSDIRAKFSLDKNITIPNDLTAKYDSHGNLQFSINGKTCTQDTAELYIIRKNNIIHTQTKKSSENIKTKKQVPEDKNTKLSKTSKGLVALKLTPEEKTKMEAKAKKEGFNPTNGAEYGWYKKVVKGKLRHFHWNTEKQTFEEKKKVSYVNNKGEGLY